MRSVKVEMRLFVFAGDKVYQGIDNWQMPNSLQDGVLE